jgi:hypothetical protein
MRLTELANRFGSDKGTIHNEAHAYTILYEAMFGALLNVDCTLVEVGLQIGGPEHGESVERITSGVPSIAIWQSYGPTARIFGIDICDFSSFEKDNFRFLRANCGSRTELAQAASEIGLIDIFIDDASHASYHQQLTFSTFFPKVRRGGIYIIEDLHWQPPHIEEVLPRAQKTAQLFKNLSICPEEEISREVWELKSTFSAIGLFSAATLAAMRRYYNVTNNLPVHHEDNVVDPPLQFRVLESVRSLFRKPREDLAKLLFVRKG